MLVARHSTLLLASLLFVGWAPKASAGDVLVTFEGVVSHTTGLQAPMPRFGFPAPGTPFHLVVSVITPGAPGAGTLFSIDPTESQLTIGAASAPLEMPGAGGLEMIDNDPTYGDWIGLTADVTGLSGLRVNGALFDTTESLIATEDAGALSGQTLLPASATQLYELRSYQGAIRLSVSSISFEAQTPQPIGRPYCAAAPNSTGAAGELSAVGLADPAQNALSLTASSLPANQPGLFLASTAQDFVAHPAGSVGNLCLGGVIGRFNGPGQVQSSGAAGSIHLSVDLTAIPQGGGVSPALSGQVWNFQLWHRDFVAGAATSNFTRGYSVAFL